MRKHNEKTALEKKTRELNKKLRERQRKVADVGE